MAEVTYYATLGKHFWIKHQSYAFSLSEIALYFYLLDSCNNGRWENPFPWTTKKIMSELGLKEDTITRAKRRLKSVGLIDFDTVQGSKFSQYFFLNLPKKSASIGENGSNFRETSAELPQKYPKKSASFDFTPIIDKKDKNKDKETPTPFLVLPFENEEFKAAWQQWLNYRIEIKKPYRSKLSIPKALEDLVKKSKNNYKTAIAILNQSIANGWTGFFELKDEKKSPVEKSEPVKLVYAHNGKPLPR